MNSNWSYSPETVKMGRDLCDLDLWPLTLTFCMDLTSVIGNNMMIRWWEHSQKGVTDRRTDGQTDRQTENTICRAAWSQLKSSPYTHTHTHTQDLNLTITVTLSLTHWGRVTHICVDSLTIIGWYNGLSSGRCQTIIWTNTGILLFGPLGTNFSEILIRIHKFAFEKMD